VPTTERKRVNFEEEEGLEHYGMTAEIETNPQESVSIAAYFTDDMFALPTEVALTPGIPDDDIDLDLYSDSVEEPELKGG
jgi:hypothetical protein